jgi:glycosyltransferase involved in cell wall biosynthesis
MIPRKGIMALLRSWRQFEEGNSEKASLVLVGDGHQRAALEDYCRIHGLESVHFVGSVDYDHMAKWYGTADVLVMPTLEDNWSLVVPEAMACGLPIVCSRYNGCWPELVQPDKNGWVFDPLDSHDTLRVLRLAVDNAKALPQMGNESRKIAGRFTPKHAAESILEACRIAEKQPRH